MGNYFQTREEQTLMSVNCISQPLRMAASLWYIRMGNISVPECSLLRCITSNCKSFG